MNICFLMYPWEEIVPENDTSLALIHECVRRNHGVALCSPANLTIRNSVTNAFCTVIKHQSLSFQQKLNTNTTLDFILNNLR